MPSINDITSDILVTLGETFDDADRVLGVMRNVQISIDKLNDEILTKALRKGDGRSVANMLTRFVVNVETFVASNDSLYDYHAFTLPAETYSLPYDGGLSYVRYHKNGLPKDCPPQIARTRFTETTLAALTTIYGSAYQAPNARKPYYARDDVRVYIYGVDPSITKLEIGLYAVVPDLTVMDPDAQITLPPEYMVTLKRLVLMAERFALQVPQERLHNDGRSYEPNQVVRTDPTMSINDPTLQDN